MDVYNNSMHTNYRKKEWYDSFDHSLQNSFALSALKMLYFSMVHSHLSYCINIYSCANSTTLNSLRLKQKAAIRIVCNAGFPDHTNPLFKQMGILPLNELIKFLNLKFMHQFWHKKLPLSFHETWSTNRARNPNIALRNADNLQYMSQHTIMPPWKECRCSLPKGLEWRCQS